MILGLDMDPLCLINPDPNPGISCPTAEKIDRIFFFNIFCRAPQKTSKLHKPQPHHVLTSPVGHWDLTCHHAGEM
jgi:hypothetical protein